jgi:uncharacterized membrane protein YcjF (UPF0283 family)
MLTFYRVLQVIGGTGVVGCLLLVLQGTPLLGEGWSRARMLYAAAGMLPALALIAIGEIGRTVWRLRTALARSEAALARIEKRLDG